jgi:hypothetical protein
MTYTTTSEEETIVILPNDNDILLGRGGRNNQHSGNEQLRELARQHTMQYCLSTKKEKSRLISKLVKTVHDMSPPGRFLRNDKASGSWVVVPLFVAKEKASQALRDAIAECEDRMKKSNESESDNDDTIPSTPSRSEIKHKGSFSLSSPPKPGSSCDAMSECEHRQLHSAPLQSRPVVSSQEYYHRLKCPPPRPQPVVSSQELTSTPWPQAVASQAPPYFLSSNKPPNFNQMMFLIGDSPIPHVTNKSSLIPFNPLEIQLEDSLCKPRTAVHPSQTYRHERRAHTPSITPDNCFCQQMDDDPVHFGKEILEDRELRSYLQRLL